MCENNYEISDYIVEFWNTISSFSLCVLGLYDIFVCYKLKARGNEYLIGLLIITIGLGSAAFHGTLRFEYQLWDELPMIWVAMT